MPVLRLSTRGIDQPGDTITQALEQLEKQGAVVVSILPLQEEWLIFYTKPKRETRAKGGDA